MKWFANILVVTVLAVSVELEYHPPAFVMMATSGEQCGAQEKSSCCATSQPEQPHKNKKDACNPMRECSGCVCCATGPVKFSFKVFRHVSDAMAVAEDLSVVEFHTSFWHPPQSLPIS